MALMALNISHQAHAVIPARENTKPWKDKKIRSIEKNELLKRRNA